MNHVTVSVYKLFCELNIVLTVCLHDFEIKGTLAKWRYTFKEKVAFCY